MTMNPTRKRRLHFWYLSYMVDKGEGERKNINMVVRRSDTNDTNAGRGGEKGKGYFCVYKLTFWENNQTRSTTHEKEKRKNPVAGHVSIYLFCTVD